ncbi:MAG: AraC family transcriptional regulator [Desulfobacteraceae bacterium]|nr:MAG: AraC family transcriptional regulator [Desulfobacteraceae bacterium]
MIAFRPGYSDAGNFSPAFRQWFGMSPGEYTGSL